VATVLETPRGGGPLGQYRAGPFRVSIERSGQERPGADGTPGLTGMVSTASGSVKAGQAHPYYLLWVLEGLAFVGVVGARLRAYPIRFGWRRLAWLSASLERIGERPLGSSKGRCRPRRVWTRPARARTLSDEADWTPAREGSGRGAGEVAGHRPEVR
jgi:hypothetical protein